MLLFTFTCFYSLSLAFIYFYLLLFTFTCVLCVALKKENCAGTPNYFTTGKKKTTKFIILTNYPICNHP